MFLTFTFDYTFLIIFIAFSFYKAVFICLNIFSLACSIVHPCIVQPAAFIWPPPPKARHISETFTYSFERKEHFIPFSDSVKNTETSTP